MTAEIEPLRWAAGYAAIGLVVHPCCPPTHGCPTPGKVPWNLRTGRPLGGWQAAAVPTPEETAGWLATPSGRAANIGANTGHGLAWLDVDGPEGEVDLRDVLGPEPPATWEYRRGDHSRRLIYAVDMPHIPTIGGDAGHAGLRIMGEGGQCVPPPSLHLSGQRYAWVPGRMPKDGTAALAPASLVERLRAALKPAPPILPVTAPASVPERLSRRMQAVLRDGPAADPIRYPSRSEAEHACVWSLIRAGYDDGEILAILLAQPWIAAMRSNPAKRLQGEVARALAAGARPDTLEPMAFASAAAAFRALPLPVRRLLADEQAPKRRRAGMAQAARLGTPQEALVAFALARNGGDVEEARSLARWAARKAQGGASHAS